MTPTEQARAILAKHVTLCAAGDHCWICHEREVLIADIAGAIEAALMRPRSQAPATPGIETEPLTPRSDSE